MSRASEKLLAFVLVAAVAFTGGTVRFRASGTAAGDTSRAPATESVTRLPAPTADTATTPALSGGEDGGETVPAGIGTVTEPVETAAPSPTPEPKQAETYSLHFVGDCTLACNAYYQGGPLGYDTVVGDDYAYPFAKTIQYFAGDDFTFANLEVALTESDYYVDKTFRFKTHAEYARVMSEGSVEFVGLANNHVLDYGEEGYADTKAAVEAVGLSYAGRDEWAIYETDRGMKIGVYAVSFGSSAQIKAGVEAVKAAGAEFVIAALHFGDEGSYQVNADQMTAARAAVDAGADFVYGSHPHTLQPYELYNGVYIFYSMGNWTFGGNTDPRDKDTLILHLTVQQDPDGSVAVTDMEIIPCACSGTAQGNNFQPVPYEPGTEEYDRTLSKLDGSFTGQNLSIGYGYSAHE